MRMDVTNPRLTKAYPAEPLRKNAPEKPPKLTTAARAPMNSTSPPRYPSATPNSGGASSFLDLKLGVVSIGLSKPPNPPVVLGRSYVYLWLTARIPLMPGVSYRKAAAKDFPEILGLIRGSVDDLLRDHGFFESSPFASPKQASIAQTGFPWFEMELKEDNEGFWVAEIEGKIAGITLSWVRGSLWYLAHLFVSTAYQGLDIGRNLMEKALNHGKGASITNRALVTFAYNRVSISLYARNGMYPREPLYYMECPSTNIKKETNTMLTHERITDFQKARSIIRDIDKVTTGYPREKNHEFMFALPTVQFHLFSQNKEPVGYAYTWQTGRIGPLATTSENAFQDALISAFNVAKTNGAPTVGMLATGSNDKLMEIALEQKMRILDNWLLMSAKPFQNFSNYVVYPTGAIL